MTVTAAHFSITIKVAEREWKLEAEIVRGAIEESIQRIAITTGQESLTLSIQEIDYQRCPSTPWMAEWGDRRTLVGSSLRA